MVRLIKLLVVYSQNFPNAHLLQLISRHAVIRFKLTKVISSPYDCKSPIHANIKLNIFVGCCLGAVKEEIWLMAIAKLSVEPCRLDCMYKTIDISFWYHKIRNAFVIHFYATKVLWKLHNIFEVIYDVHFRTSVLVYGICLMYINHKLTWHRK